MYVVVRHIISSLKVLYKTLLHTDADAFSSFSGKVKSLTHRACKHFATPRSWVEQAYQEWRTKFGSFLCYTVWVQLNNHTAVCSTGSVTETIKFKKKTKKKQVTVQKLFLR